MAGVALLDVKVHLSSASQVDCGGSAMSLSRIRTGLVYFGAVGATARLPVFLKRGRLQRRGP